MSTERNATQTVEIFFAILTLTVTLMLSILQTQIERWMHVLVRLHSQCEVSLVGTVIHTFRESGKDETPPEKIREM